MMGECFAPNIYSRLQGIKYCTKRKCHLVGTFLKLIHDIQTDEHKKKDLNSWFVSL
jgi:hypothetical protein